MRRSLAAILCCICILAPSSFGFQLQQIPLVAHSRNRPHRQIQTKTQSSTAKQTTTLLHSSPPQTSRPPASAYVASTALITGTAIGAGVLSLPQLSLPLNFVPSAFLLFCSYVAMLTSALTMAENQISLTPTKLKDNPASPPLSYSQLVQETLGPKGETTSTAAYLFLHYAILCSYFSSGGGYVQKFSPMPLPPFSTPVLYALITTLPIFLLPEATMASVNNLLVLGALASFVGIVSLGIPTADTAILEIPANLPDWPCVAAVIPIFLLTLVFHNVIPSVTKNLNYDRNAVFSCITVGSSIPFLLFLVYDFTILGNVPGFTTVVDPIAVLQEAGGANGEALPDLVAGFCFLAITTSLVGFVDGLQTIFNPIFEKNPQQNLIVPALITIPPVLVSCFGEDVFLTALNLGATFGVTLLFLILPALTAIKDRGVSLPNIGMLLTAALALSSTLVQVPPDFVLK
ncbi:hypothetical protein TrST_g10676 [Triparma strigata]|uniref:Tyrosine-specific transport protein n=1 Tax=Triparma strigata TaxID=1606541 RepID=A0A9W7EYY6_9STRA|nr:hypothetical protein TrST_g10676 [Triparma strigata]